MQCFFFFYITPRSTFKQNKMISYAEQFPVEIWLSIFSYLEAQDLFHAFINLNSYFDQLLNCDYLTLTIKLKKRSSNYHPRRYTKFMNNSVLNRTITFDSLIGKRHGEFICRFLLRNSDKFNRLQSLRL